MAKLSIIVPIYNVEKYLSRCIQSILAQTYKDFELILVNDGSTDSCFEIIQEYAEKDERIVVIDQENKGVSSARNEGLKISKGRYVGFVDPDDWIEPNMYDRLVDSIEKTGTDIACCNFCDFYLNGTIESHVIKGVDYVMQKYVFIKHIFDKPRTIFGSSWNKLFIREKIKNMYDENIKIGEDTLFLIYYCMNIKKACFIDEPLYNVFVRADSATRKNPAKLVEGLKVTEEIINILSKESKTIAKYAEEDYLDSCYRLYNLLKDSEEREYFHEARNRLEVYVKDNLWKVLYNNKIYWKTKIIYLIKVFFNKEN